MKRAYLLLGIVLAAIGALGIILTFGYYYYSFPDIVSRGSFLGSLDSSGMMMFRGNGYMDPGLMQNMMTDLSKSDYESEGEMIFLTSIDNKGNIIEPRSGPGAINGRMMMMRPLSCASCHGIDAEGGYSFPDGKTKSADIRWKTLEKEFDEGSFKKAVKDGVDHDGGRLSYYMPRWDISDKDLDELLKYLKTF